MNENFEMRGRDGPARRGKIILMVENADISVQRMISGISNLTVDEDYFLVNLERDLLAISLFEKYWLRSGSIPMNCQRSTQSGVRMGSLELVSDKVR